MFGIKIKLRQKRITYDKPHQVSQLGQKSLRLAKNARDTFSSHCDPGFTQR